MGGAAGVRPQVTEGYNTAAAIGKDMEALREGTLF